MLCEAKWAKRRSTRRSPDWLHLTCFKKQSPYLRGFWSHSAGSHAWLITDRNLNDTDCMTNPSALPDCRGCCFGPRRLRKGPLPSTVPSLTPWRWEKIGLVVVGMRFNKIPSAAQTQGIHQQWFKLVSQGLLCAESPLFPPAKGYCAQNVIGRHFSFGMAQFHLGMQLVNRIEGIPMNSSVSGRCRSPYVL